MNLVSKRCSEDAAKRKGLRRMFFLYRICRKIPMTFPKMVTLGK